jgi:diguanylate cyclase (GGDEF)-like protein
VQAAQVAERLRGACAGLAWHPQDAAARLTASIGVASLELDDTGVAGLFRRADGALYEAKHAGRNRVIAR